MRVRVICRVMVFCICCLLALPVAAEDGLWEWVTPLPQGHDLYAASIGNGVRVAVGENGTVITSTDGAEWRTSRTGEGYRLSDVVWGNGLFVAVGGNIGEELSPGLGVILTSDDGFNWIERHREDYLTLEAVIWTGSQFVAVGVGDRVLISTDGRSWSEKQLESPAAMHDLAWNGTGLVALGRDNTFAGRYSFFTSENGEEWQVQNFECDYCDPGSIAAVSGRFVVVGPWLKALVSDDAMTWTEVLYESPGEFRMIVAGDDRFLAMGRDVVGTSLDGYVWSIEEQPTSGVSGLAWLGDGYLAVGGDGFMMSSSDGSQWTQLSEKAFDVGGNREINELATNGSTIVGVGEGSVIITGKHGAEWVRRYSPTTDGELYSVIWNGSAFWTAGSDGILMSVDGIHWERRLLDYDISLFDIVWNGSLFMAVGWYPSSDDGRKLILTSPDGNDWSYQWFDSEDHFWTVGWTGLRFVVAGGGDHFMTSIGGEFWQEHLWGEELELTDMASNGDRLVAVGGFIYSTVDGVHWEESILPEVYVSSFNDVTWTGTHFVAVARTSGQSVFTSTDGVFWSSETTGIGVGPVSVVGDDRSLFATGRGLQIIRRVKPLADSEPPRRPGRRVVPVGEKVREASAIQE